MWRSSPRTTQVTRVSSRCHLVIILFAVKISDNLTALHYAVSQPGPGRRTSARQEEEQSGQHIFEGEGVHSDILVFIIVSHYR